MTSRRKLFPTSRRSYVTDTSYISEMYRVKNTKFSLRVKKTFASIFWKCSQKYMEMDFRRLEIHVCIQSKLQSTGCSEFWNVANLFGHPVLLHIGWKNNEMNRKSKIQLHYIKYIMDCLVYILWVCLSSAISYMDVKPAKSNFEKKKNFFSIRWEVS